MDDESRVDEWMNTMAFHICPEDLEKINSSDFTQSVLAALVKRTCPENIVKDAKHVLLYNDVLLSSGQNKNCMKWFGAELQLMDRRNKLKERLIQKENELTEKHKEYIQLIERNKKLLQEAQKNHSILKEVNKKTLYMTLNEKKLEENLKLWHYLGKTVSELKEILKRKREIQTPKDLNIEIMEAMKICRGYIDDLHKKTGKQSVEFPSTNSDYENCDNSTVLRTWQREIISFVAGRTNAFPWHMIFEALLAQQKELTQNIQSVLNCENVNSRCGTARTTNTGQQTEEHKLRIALKQIVSAVLHRNDLKESGTSEIRLHGNTFYSHSYVTKEENINERLHYIDHRIQEKWDDCKTIKSQLLASFAKVSHLRSQIKKYPKLFETMQERSAQSAVHLNDLCPSVQLLCNIGLKEVQLFSEIPLAAIQKVPFSREKRIPVYKLISTYHKVLCTSGVDLSSFSVMQGASGVAPQDLLLSVWKQLMYLCVLCNSQQLVKPFIGIDTKLHIQNLWTRVSTVMKQIYKEALANLSEFESHGDEIDQLLSIVSKASLNAAVPRNFLVDGVSIDCFTEFYNKLPNPENSFDTIPEESM